MHRTLTARVAALAALMVLAAGVAQAETAPTQTFYLRNDGTDCGAASHPFLADRAGSNDLGCGYIGGGPFGEIFTATGVDTSKTYTTEVPLNLLLDATRDVTGKITVVPYAGVTGTIGSGVGQIIVQITASGGTAKGDIVDLGTVTKEVTATPAASPQEILFEFNVDDAANQTALTDVSLKVDVRGLHAAHGFTELNGASLLKVPFHEPVIVEPTPTPAP